MTRILRALCSLATLTALVVGAPLLLWRVGRWDGFTTLRWSMLLQPTEPTGLVLSVMTLAAWLAWLVVTASVVAEVASLATRGRVHVRVPGGGWVQPVVGSLVVAVASLVAVPGQAAVAHAAGPSPTPAAPSSASAPAVPQATPSVAPATPAPAATGRTARYVVTAGDDLWSIAEQHYGDGTQWRRIADDNHLDASAQLVPGRVLVLTGLPPEASAATPTPSAPAPATPTTASAAPATSPAPAGTLGSALARAASAGVVGGAAGGVTPRAVPSPARPVTTPPVVTTTPAPVAPPATTPSTLPAHAPARPAQAVRTRLVVVHEGDTLSSLAQRHLGDAGRWPEIHALNRALVTDPDLIEPGWQLRIPVAPGLPSTGGPGPAAVAPRPAEPTATRTPTSAPPSRVPAPAAVAVPGKAATAPRPSVAPQAPVSSAPTSVAAAATPGPVIVADAPVTAGPGRPATPHQAATPTAPPVPSHDHRPTQLPAAAVEDDQATDPSLAAIGGMGVVLAAALSAAIGTRRRRQQVQRAAGRRLLHPSPEAQHLVAAITHAAATAPPPPDDAAPTVALLGERDGTPVLHDVEQAGTTTIDGPAGLVDAATAALVTGLALQPWSAEAEVVIAGEMPWMRALDEPQVVHVATVAEALDRLEALVARRRLALARLALHVEHDADTEPARRLPAARPTAHASPDGRIPPTLDGLRADPDTWEAWRPVVHVLATGATTADLARAAKILDGPAVGASVVVAHVTGGTAHLALDEATGTPTARLGDGAPFLPHLVDATARRALFEVFDALGSDRTTPAPWWSSDGDLPPTITALPRRSTGHIDEEEPVEPSAATHPTLYLLGPLDLRGCRGEEPARARRQCIEYCAWIAMHPGHTATMMSRELLVAETTRRSNLSRLRSWLGDDPDGQPYLPDAYSGRIELHPAVTSDWEHLELLVSGGVNRATADALVEALRLVRGAPLADAAPGQWGWAEAIRVDMASTVRDVALVLANRALDEHDLDLARWAAARGLVAVPNDELLLGARLRTEHLSGNRPEVERLVLQVTRSARNLGVDLRDETVGLLQEVMEGRRRMA